MNALVIAAVVFVCVFCAPLLAFMLRGALPEHHLSADTKDTVRITMALVATMAALMLGLLVASAKGSYDTQKSEVIEMSAKVAFFDRILALYGPETAPAREALQGAITLMVARVWPENVTQTAGLKPNASSADTLYHAIQNLVPQTDEQRALKTQAIASVYELGQIRWLLFAQTGSSISAVLLIIVVCWLAILFFSFGMFSPANGTVIVALMLAAFSVAGAIFLILELDNPFGGLLRVSSQPMLNALSQLMQ
ncbi:MAG: DUF4239 domain-containing protein [bacterium]|nr:DUF4239 domain-containing protein [bacterium]